MKSSSGNRISGTRIMAARLVALSVVLLVVGPIERAEAVVSRPILKSFFQTGDKPTQQQFATLIDSVLSAELHYGNSAAEHGISFQSGRVAIDSSGYAQVFGAGDVIDGLDNFGGLGDDIHFNPLATGGAQDITTGGEYILSGRPHYGFLQLRIDPPDSATPYAIHLRHFVYEETPGMPITVFLQAVPEPTTLALVGAGALVLAGRRRRK